MEGGKQNIDSVNTKTAQSMASNATPKPSLALSTFIVISFIICSIQREISGFCDEADVLNNDCELKCDLKDNSDAVSPAANTSDQILVVLDVNNVNVNESEYTRHVCFCFFLSFLSVFAVLKFFWLFGCLFARGTEWYAVFVQFILFQLLLFHHCCHLILKEKEKN